MNASEYIASGILEVYVLQELPPAEATEVENVATQHPEVRTEIMRIAATYQTLADQLPISPRSSLRENILDQLAPVSAEADRTSAAQPDKTSSAPRQTSPAASQKTRNLLPLRLGIAASLLIALLSIAAALYFRSQWQQTEQELDEVLTQNQEIATQYETASQRAQTLAEDLSVVTSADYQQISLAGTDVSPNSSAVVYWNARAAQVYLNTGNLPTPPTDRQYQLWAIVDGSPVSVGVFDVTDNDRDEPSLRTMRERIPDAEAFAITLEPRGGSESPTMEAMYVQGTADS